MESTVPLLAVKYLQWRATLYTAVCQCYFDCKAGQHGEVKVHTHHKHFNTFLTRTNGLLCVSLQEFARRALTKINELSQLEAMSSHKESKEVEEIFRYATVKV